MLNFWDFSNGHFFIAIVLALCNAVLLCVESKKFMQISQLNGYHLHGYMSWLTNTRGKYFLRVLMVVVLSALCILVTNVVFRIFVEPLKYYLCYLGLVFYVMFSIIFIKVINKTPQKTPLVMTSRIKRAYVMLYFLCVIVSFGLILLSSTFVDIIGYGGIALTPLFIPILVPFAHLLLKPLEKIIQNCYIKKARKKLKMFSGLKIVGITGSFGKTTTKKALETILSEKYSVCASPQSFNTPMGITKTVLENLMPTNQILIAEMGARQRGDINELCNLVQPTFGILTSVGYQHMQTFGSFENVKRTKAELPNFLGKNGFCVFNGDDEAVLDISKSFEGEKQIVSLSNKSADVFASDITVSKNGTTFKLFLDKKPYDCTTKLLGVHNISNILLCATLAKKLELSPEQIVSGIAKIRAVPHRLELVNAENNVIVLDDSYNASIVGGTRALEVLQMFENRRKIVITPGIVELGSMERFANYQFGKQIAEKADIVIIVNKTNLLALKQGLVDSNFDTKNIFEVENTLSSQDLLKKIIKNGDVVLWENDLPDNYI